MSSIAPDTIDLEDGTRRQEDAFARCPARELNVVNSFGQFDPEIIAVDILQPRFETELAQRANRRQLRIPDPSIEALEMMAIVTIIENRMHIPFAA